ncbi:hypothetical protein [Priestia megaterium]|uniref:hypothetical protein n=1 Tax=Priestia megaterium TaxID=1404 RepID=UPI001F134201|nr:hypothetical protein [Priestia megaterium]UMZ36009.1 hypothetical protein MGJ28_28115 [Priestia megaterium]
MGKRKGTKKNNDKVARKNKEFIVITKYVENYKPFDTRANKPICFKENPLRGGDASMVLQEVDTIPFSTRINGKKNNINYYAPNNIGILLSVSNKSLLDAKEIFKTKLNPDSINHSKESDGLDRNDSIIEKSKIIYEFIEKVQTSIVFGYTALETFSNLSIPEDYQYKNEANNKGIIEIFDKDAIERWVTLKVKISEILTDIYETKDIKNLKIWSQFLNFEKMRNEIIHQKTITDTKFYHKYFKKEFLSICDTPEEIIKFFFEELKDKKRTNPLWPWIINYNNGIPTTYEFNSEDFEVIGNLYEGRSI